MKRSGFCVLIVVLACAISVLASSCNVRDSNENDLNAAAIANIIVYNNTSDDSRRIYYPYYIYKAKSGDTDGYVISYTRLEHGSTYEDCIVSDIAAEYPIYIDIKDGRASIMCYDLDFYSEIYNKKFNVNAKEFEKILKKREINVPADLVRYEYE